MKERESRALLAAYADSIQHDFENLSSAEGYNKTSFFVFGEPGIRTFSKVDAFSTPYLPCPTGIKYGNLPWCLICWSSINPPARFAEVINEPLNAGQLKEIAADSMDWTHEFIDKHYDKAMKNEQMERREEIW